MFMMKPRVKTFESTTGCVAEHREVGHMRLWTLCYNLRSPHAFWFLLNKAEMVLRLFRDKISLGQAAAGQAATAIVRAIQQRGTARILVATGASQLEFLEALTQAHDIDWAKVEAFHLDEYIGMPATHPASFRKYLSERLAEKTGIGKFHFLEGDANDIAAVIREVGRQVGSAPIDVAFIGIGENGHIAFNDPPADFETEEPYVIVTLDEPCRRQQAGEGWFSDISEVPARAISMSVQQIMKAKEIVSVVPDGRKARAVKMCLEGEISPMAPASVLQRHPNVTVYLDEESASLLSGRLKTALEDKSQVTLNA
jgi:glucosamine-6-phosphate deaminase